MVQKQSKADIFESAVSAINRNDISNAKKLFQHGAIEGKFLVLESCDFLRGVGMVELLDPASNRTSSQSIARVARSIDYYGLYANDSKAAKDWASAIGTPKEAYPFGNFQANQTTQYAFNFSLTTPGRWCAAAALDLMDDGTPSSMEQAYKLLLKGYEVDKLPPGQHQILDLSMALLCNRAELYDKVIEAAAPHANILPDWSEWENKPGVSDTGETTSMRSDLARALLATAHAHLGQFDNATAVGETSMNSAPALAQACFIMACIARAKGRDKEEVNRLFANAESSNPYREDIKKAHENEKFLLRQTTPEMIAKRTNMWDVSTEPSLAAQQAMESAEGRQALVDEALAELDSYIGLAKVKEAVRNLANKIALDKKRQEMGAEVSSSNLSITFQGPPGVGKTSVARILHKIMYGYGIIKEDAFVEVDRSGLIGEYQGESVRKTIEQLVKAQHGTFFLDEAYSLVQNEQDMYGQEALNTIVKFMEDHRGEMCIILAGYEGDMKKLLRRNEGLNSRFQQHIPFESYTPHELTQIVEVVAKRKSRFLEDGALEAVEKILTERLVREEDGGMVTDTTGKTLIDKMGNGRGALNIIEAADPIASARLQNHPNPTLEILSTYTVEDMVAATNVVIDRTLNS